jgi:hypothetical protein
MTPKQVRLKKAIKARRGKIDSELNQYDQGHLDYMISKGMSNEAALESLIHDSPVERREITWMRGELLNVLDEKGSDDGNDAHVTLMLRDKLNFISYTTRSNTEKVDPT